MVIYSLHNTDMLAVTSATGLVALRCSEGNTESNTVTPAASPQSDPTRGSASEAQPICSYYCASVVGWRRTECWSFPVRTTYLSAASNDAQRSAVNLVWWPLTEVIIWTVLVPVGNLTIGAEIHRINSKSRCLRSVYYVFLKELHRFLINCDELCYTESQELPMKPRKETSIVLEHNKSYSTGNAITV